jgi:cobalt/nickel transport system permease protein
MTGLPCPTHLLAVHLSDGVLGTGWLTGGCVAIGLLLAPACWKLSEDEVPLIGLLTAALFVASLLHLPVGVGRAHLLLNALAGVILGRRAPLAVAVAVGLQALLFAHGGLTTLGVNAAVMAVPAVGAAWLFGFLYRQLRVSIGVTGFVVGLLTSATTVALNAVVLHLGGKDETGSPLVVSAIVVMHLPFVAVEAVGTAVIAAYLAKVKPEWLVTRPASPPRTAPPTDPGPG